MIIMAVTQNDAFQGREILAEGAGIVQYAQPLPGIKQKRPLFGLDQAGEAVLAQHRSWFMGAVIAENGQTGKLHEITFDAFAKTCWMAKRKFVLQGLAVFQGRRHTSGMSRS
jgi:hypothetical protein